MKTKTYVKTIENIDPMLCLRCKGGGNLCKLGYCPRLKMIEDRFPPLKVTSGSFMGPSPPSIFVGRYGYPYVSVSPLVSPYSQEDPGFLDRPRDWFGLSVEEIIIMRRQLYRVQGKCNIHSIYTDSSTKDIVEAARIIALSNRYLDVEVKLNKKPPLFQVVKFDLFVQPMGPVVEPRKIDVIDNPKVPRRVDALVNDTDIRVSEAVRELYSNGIDETYITRILSAGLLGNLHRRRLVPTRWAITAVDDTIAKALLPAIKSLPEINTIHIYHAKYIGNSIFILFIPGKWSFEMVETWMKGSFWASTDMIINDWEGYRGRKNYASNITGAYYAARLAVLEHMNNVLKRQATVIIYREITEEYLAPLGVWVIRETTREAFKKRPVISDSIQDAIGYINKRVRAKNWVKKSHIIKELTVQTRLEDFVSV